MAAATVSLPLCLRPSDGEMVLSNVTHEVVAVSVDECYFESPWHTVVLSLDTPGCMFLFPDCGSPGTNLTFLLDAEGSPGETLWNMTWSSPDRLLSFSATRVDNGLWLEYDDSVAVLALAPSHTFIRFNLSWSNDSLTLWHDHDPLGSLTVPWPSFTHTAPQRTCGIGPAALNLVEGCWTREATQCVDHWTLWSRVSSVSRCHLKKLNLSHDNSNWGVLHDQATFSLPLQDFLRCQPDREEALVPLSNHSTGICLDSVVTRSCITIPRSDIPLCGE